MYVCMIKEVRQKKTGQAVVVDAVAPGAMI